MKIAPNVPPMLLMGPTASGKTALAMALAEQLPVEIISVDSALVYRGLDIGSAKPDAEMRALVPHHLIDILDPCEPYRSEEHTSALQSLMRISYAVFCLKQKKRKQHSTLLSITN